MKQKVYRCGACGKPGHNRQTCGQVKSNPTTVKPTVTHPSQKVEKSNITTWDNHLTNINTLTHDSDVENDMYTVEDMSTLWAIMNGKTGSREENGWSPVDSGELQEFINNTHEQFPDLPHETWVKFFSQFDEETKMYTLGQYSERWEKRRKGTDVVELPEKLYAVFMADKSEDVRGSLVGKTNTPTEVTDALINEGNLRAITRIVSSRKIGKAMLERIIEMMPTVEKKMWESGKKKDAKATQLGMLLRVKNQLAENPNTPPSYLTELLHDPVAVFPASTNPSTPVVKIEKLVNDYYKTIRNMPKLIAQADEMVNTLETQKQPHEHSKQILSLINELKEKKTNAEEALRVAESSGYIIVSGGRCSDKINKKYIDMGLRKAMTAARKGESLGGQHAFVNKTIQETNLTAQQIQKYYTMIGGVGTPLKDSLTTLLAKDNIPVSIVEECEAYAQENQSGNVWLIESVKRAKAKLHPHT